MSDESYDDLLARHRKEIRDLTAQTTALKKQATKGEKKKKKDILKNIEVLEAELKAKHAAEITSFNGINPASTDEADQDLDNDNDNDNEQSIAEQLLAQLELEEKQQQQEQEQNKKQANPQPSQGPKRNRRKEKIAQREAASKKLSEEAAKEALSQPDLRKIELENLDALCKLQNLVQQDIKPDGHCLFASIADQLSQRLSIVKTVQELRTDAAGYIRANPDTFSPFLFDENTLTIKEIEPYCVELESTPIWGGDMEILALSKVYDCCISVMFSGRSTLKVNEEGTNPELKLVYYKHSFGLGEHYNSLRDDK